jgi:hypothetical protein
MLRIFSQKGRRIGTASVHSIPQIFAQDQLYAASLINSSNLITFDQIVTDLLGTV